MTLPQVSASFKIVRHCQTVNSLRHTAGRRRMNRISFKQRVGFHGFRIPEIFAEKIQPGRRYLKETGLGITEIAALTGFGNITYFEKVFKKLTESTPQQYRKSMTSADQK